MLLKSTIFYLMRTSDLTMYNFCFHQFCTPIFLSLSTWKRKKTHWSNEAFFSGWNSWKQIITNENRVRGLVDWSDELINKFLRLGYRCRKCNDFNDFFSNQTSNIQRGQNIMCNIFNEMQFSISASEIMAEFWIISVTL